MRIGVLDFFCGCGGVSYGFKQARIPGVTVEIVAGIDIDPHSCATYRRMVGAPAETLDILEMSERPEILSSLRAAWALERFDKLVVVGCAPCQGFAAHRKAIMGEDNRRSLFAAFCEVASVLEPDAILMENVPDIFSKKYWPFFIAGRDALEQSGYSVRSRICNFATFGLPQERFRAVIMAMKRPFDMPEPLLDHESFISVRQAIGHLPPLTPGEVAGTDLMHVTSRHRPETVATLAQVPTDGGNRPMGVGPKCLDRTREKHGGYTDVYGRLAWDRPAVTITARCRTPSCGRFAHPEQNRGLSIREAGLLQGFPEDYFFEGPFDDKYKQIGNAVPPLVAKVLAEHLIGQIALQAGDRLPSEEVGDVREPVGPGFAVTINGIKRQRARSQVPADA